MFKKIVMASLVLFGFAGAVRAEDGSWESTQITFSHRRLANGTTEIDWHTERSSSTAREAAAALVRRQMQINIGRMARYTLHYKELSAVAQLQKEVR